MAAPESVTIAGAVRHLWSGRRRWSRLGRHVDASVPLQKSLVGGCEEREAVEEVLVVDFDALRQTRARVAGDDQADEDAVDVDLVTVRRDATAKASAIRKRRIDGNVQRKHIASGPVGDWNR